MAYFSLRRSPRISRPDSISSSSVSPFSRSTAPMRSSAFIATTSWGVIKIPSGVSITATRSPFFSPSLRRSAVGMVTWPFSWTRTSFLSAIVITALEVILYKSITSAVCRAARVVLGGGAPPRRARRPLAAAAPLRPGTAGAGVPPSLAALHRRGAARRASLRREEVHGDGGREERVRLELLPRHGGELLGAGDARVISHHHDGAAGGALWLNLDDARRLLEGVRHLVDAGPAVEQLGAQPQAATIQQAHPQVGCREADDRRQRGRRLHRRGHERHGDWLGVEGVGFQPSLGGLDDRLGRGLCGVEAHDNDGGSAVGHLAQLGDAW